MNLTGSLASIFLGCSLLAAQTSTSSPSTPSTPSDRRTGSTQATDRSTGDGRYVLPAGTEIEVRINEALSSETAQQGDRFTGEVSNDVMDRDINHVLIFRGAQVEGRVLSATPSGRLTDSGELQLSINTIRTGSSVMNVSVQPFIDKGESHTKSNTTKIGGGAALGAIIGAIAGGGKGAAIGAGVGGAAGAGAAAAGGKRPAEIKPEAVLKFVTSSDLTVSAQSTATQPSATGSSSTYPTSPRTTTGPSYPSSSTSTSTTTSTDPNFPAPSSTSSTSDEAPVLQKRSGGIAANSTTGSTTKSGTTTTSAPASGGTYGPSGPGTTSSTASSAGASPYPSTTGSTTPQSTYPSTTTSATTSAPVSEGRTFSARDRRVANACVRDHASSLPDSALRKAMTTRSFQKGEVIPADVQRQLRALPLQCDRELPVLSNDLERVIYGGQVMLIDTNNRVLDIFELIQ